MSAQEEKPKDEDFAKEVAGGLRSVFDRIGEFFNLFDLSFFVSGTATFSAVLYWFLRQKTDFALARLPSWAYIVGLAVACYICGLLSFAAGRICTTKLPRKKRTQLLERALKGHNLEAKVHSYLESGDKSDRLDRLYERLWVEVRQAQKHIISFSLLRRYWVMAATYDGVAISCLAWAVVLWMEPPITQFSYANYVLPFLALFCAMIAFTQGYSYFKYQVFEIVATIAASKDSLKL
jgi:uncharacterized membrane protein YciS (DUF1049 family)